MKTIEIPERIARNELVPVVSFSGGKDSTALIVALSEAGVSVDHVVFADTGWENEATITQIHVVEQALGVRVSIVGRPGGMRSLVEERATFPGRKQRFCTEQLKLLPIRAYTDQVEQATGKEAVNVIGVRADESEARAKMPVWEDDEEWGGLMWRPILAWSVEDVLEAHHRAGVPVNPLYQRGHNRVGCWPCIMSNKTEIRLIAEQDPRRIDEIAGLERETTQERAQRNAVSPGRYKHEKATFFQVRHGVAPQGIREIVAWSRTERGGRQLPILQPPPDGGCFRWGACEPPTRGNE